MQPREDILVTNRSAVDEIAKKLTNKLEFQLETFNGAFPAACSINSVYPLTPNTDWTTGFWSGMTALAARITNSQYFFNHLAHQVSSFGERLTLQHDLDTHDLGFLYTLSCVNAWRMTGNERARQYALQAADKLISRYHPRAMIIQAWGDLNDPEQQGRMIIDCLMNLPLLYWASEQTGKTEYAYYARQHAINACKYLFREDHSTFHTFYMDIVSGEPRYGKTHQGYSDQSCWARGQAWAIYGCTLSYSYTGDAQFLQAALNAADYFLAHLPADNICFWDLSLTEPGTTKDTSAAAIAACGLLELVNHLSVIDPQRETFTKQALVIIDDLVSTYFDDALNQGGYLAESVYNMNKKRGVGEYCTWGDYFLFEAVSRLKSPALKYW